MAGAIFEIIGIYFGLMLWALSWWLILTSYVYILMCYWRGQWAWSNVHWCGNGACGSSGVLIVHAQGSDIPSQRLRFDYGKPNRAAWNTG